MESNLGDDRASEIKMEKGQIVSVTYDVLSISFKDK
jgi:hypothetical protein